ncbi:MAG: histidinol dehydrogenase, partial [Chloroflexia bacterium]|nr:histidinol dehydrogenase [Chloroflexia bacterium]
MDEARAQLTRRGGFVEPELSPRMMERNRELFGEAHTAGEVVDRILREVKSEGDAAVRRYSVAYDGHALDPFEIPRQAWDAALDEIDAEVRAALELAAERIKAFHEKQVRTSWFETEELGLFGQIVRPFERIGVYTPGGSAPLPSSLLMIAVPARVAGVAEIVVCAPPAKDGSVSPLILATAAVAGVDRVFGVGGAQAIAAMAYGTESIPGVDKILGPGNLFVAIAKQKVAGIVAPDQLPGPTETLLIADERADAEHVAADLLAQAEHDEAASAILLTTSAELASAVLAALERQLPEIERAAIAAVSLARNGRVVVVPSLEAAVELANAYAPEHLCLLVENPWALVSRITHAGGIFVGAESPEALGDYTAGPSHVMPTGGTARFSSPVHIGDFLRVMTLMAANDRAITELGPATIALARAEGLTAHARAIE